MRCTNPGSQMPTNMRLAPWHSRTGTASLRNHALAMIRRREITIPEARVNFRDDRAEAIAAVTGRVL